MGTFYVMYKHNFERWGGNPHENIFKAQNKHLGGNKNKNVTFLQAPYIDSKSFSKLWDVKMYYM